MRIMHMKRRACLLFLKVFAGSQDTWVQVVDSCLYLGASCDSNPVQVCFLHLHMHITVWNIPYQDNLQTLCNLCDND